MASVKDPFKSSYGAFASRERALARRRADRDASDAAAERAVVRPGDGATGPTERPST